MKTRKSIESGLSDLSKIDPRIKLLWDNVGTPLPRVRKQGYKELLRIIIGQQLSTQAAASIWQRLEQANLFLNKSNFLVRSDEDLRGLGLSRQKIKYIRGLIESINEGTLRLDCLDRSSDEEAINILVQQKGIGRWSAEVYLLFAIGRADIMPADDLALLKSAGYHFGDGKRWTSEKLRNEAEIWRPWRSAVARLLWHAYNVKVI